MFKLAALRYNRSIYLTLVVLGYIFGCMCRLYFQNDTCLDFHVRDENIVNENNLLLVAVKSTRRSLIQYGDTIMKTWASDIPGYVLFFLDNQPYTGTLPVINLPDVHNRSTSLEKTFSILKAVSATYSRNYEWLLIIDDQTFLHTERLERFLRKISSRGQNWYIGRLMKNKSYCESETGILLSRHALNTISPHLNKCFLETQSTYDDDVVLGSCIKQYLDITCTGAVEFGDRFVNNADGLFNARKINDQSVLIHPVGGTNVMYQLMRFFQIQNIAQQKIKQAYLQDEIVAMNSNLDEKKHDGVDLERKEDDYLYTFWNLVRPHTLPFNSLTHSEAKRAFTASISEKKMLLSPVEYFRFAGGKTIQHYYSAKNIIKEGTIESSYTDQTYTEPEVRFDDVHDLKTIWIIIPLYKKVSEFRKFLDVLAEVVARSKGKVVLRVVLDIDGDGDWQKNQEYAKQMQGKIVLELIISKEQFNRGSTNTLGTKDLPETSLLVFIDVDMYIDEGFLTRVRRNTIYNQQVYYPICFSQYDPKIICYQQHKCQINVKNLENRYGFWRDFGYGMVSMYKKDYLKVGGFDLTIKGWGSEDVDLYGKCVAKGLTVFRAIDPSLVHIYHTKHCSKSLPNDRYSACLRSGARHAGDGAELSKIVDSIHNIET